MKIFNLWDKKEEEMLGPFSLGDIEATLEEHHGGLEISSSAVIKRDNRQIKVNKIGSRYLERPAGETKEEYLEG